MTRARLALASAVVAFCFEWAACLPSEGGELAFKKICLDAKFRSEGVAVADVNRDGKLDVLAGTWWYEAPDWTPHEIAPPKEYDYNTGYSESFANFGYDVNGDGWTDLVLVGFPGLAAYWYENPSGQAGHWKRHEIFHSACNESPQFADLNGDGKPELVMGYEKEGLMAWAAPGADPTQPWSFHAISEPKSPGTNRFSHGLGVGDVNGDGRQDVIVIQGWWEAPEDPKAGPWKFHATPFGADCADMHVYDVDGDGDNDILSSSAHDYGIWWYEQGKSEAGEVTWKQHAIADFFSQSHSLVLVDMNGDGLKDLVTGKRYWAHNGKGDRGEREPVLLYWFELQRSAAGPKWIPHRIAEGSGVGTQFLVHDINGDGLLDVITSNKKGVFVHVGLGERGE